MRDCSRQLGLGRSNLTDSTGIGTALLVSAALMLASPLLGLWLPMPRIDARGEEAEMLEDPKVRLALTGRRGPVVVEIEYRVAQACAPLSQGDASGPAVSTAQRHLWLVDCSRHCRSRTVDGALSLPDMARLSAKAAAQLSRSARWIGRPRLSTSILSPCESDACWSARSDRFAPPGRIDSLKEIEPALAANDAMLASRGEVVILRLAPKTLTL